MNLLRRYVYVYIYIYICESLRASILEFFWESCYKWHACLGSYKRNRRRRKRSKGREKMRERRDEEKEEDP